MFCRPTAVSDDGITFHFRRFFDIVLRVSGVSCAIDEPTCNHSPNVQNAVKQIDHRNFFDAGVRRFCIWSVGSAAASRHKGRTARRLANSGAHGDSIGKENRWSYNVDRAAGQQHPDDVPNACRG